MQNWITPADMKKFDIESYFVEDEYVNWQKHVNFEIGDIVYIYCKVPIKKVMFQTRVEELGEIDGEEYAKLSLIKYVDKDRLSLENLLNHGLNFAPMNTWKLNDDLLKYIECCFKDEYEENFHEYLDKRNFYFDKRTIENFLLSLKVKPFVIFSGNSGTGKTKLAQLFADYILSRNGCFYNGGNCEIVPVGANWTENRNIVGYYNVLTKSYQHTQSLDLLLDADSNEFEPFFLILDEMNLSHVERYFSDFLSAMESGEKINLHNENEETQDKIKVPCDVGIPKNLFVIGTVNVDETTYMFSPKVLDRANVLEFKTFEEISIEDYINRKHSQQNIWTDNIDYLENPLSDLNIRDDILNLIFDEEFYSVNGSLLKDLTAELTKFHNVLKESGFEFGYRTVNEILSFMFVAWKYEGKNREWKNWRRYFDAQILQKILPKLHGSQRVLNTTLDDLLKICLGLNDDKLPDLTAIDFNHSQYPYLEAAKKLIRMRNILEKQKYVSFID